MMGLLASIGLRGGIIAAALLTAFLWHQYDRARAYSEGQRAERLVWSEQRLKDIAARETERKAAQVKIDQIESDYWAAKTDHALAMAGIEKAIEDEKTAIPGACEPVLSRKLRDQLDAIGR